MALVIEGVGKRYPGRGWALSQFTLTLEPGLTGLLGPNGAGKSTLMRILATLTRPTEGRVSWDGADLAKQPDALRDVLGYLPQDFGVYPQLSAIEFLEYLAAAKGLDARAAKTRIAELLELVNLTEAAHRPLGGYSGGMRQRVGIAQALLNDPRVLIVDEPTAGLDPEERVRLRNLLGELSGERVVLLSTHIVSDVEATAAHIALIHEGRLVAHGTPDELLARVEGRVWELAVRAEHLDDARRFWRVGAAMRRGPDVLLRVVADETPRPDAKAVAPTLEDAYLALVRGEREERDAHAGARP
ncbi:MAG: ABC transporter ATP-binding protein [Candidatus Eisenbacteria bacterium]|uniref:ABC transporter ATP-binding protein n=1 Tax=Eiseniibacteriota bacterium TaxID=2212470 RepID=A0A933SAX3_UNCEI|nr:ABC transporter ATP-binding protein [Candidatus Eisenbacteria bacterium]